MSIDESTEKELQDMEKSLTEPEEADNTEKKPESKEEETEVEAKADDTKETEDAEDTEEETTDEDEEAEAPRNPKVPYKKYKAEREKRKELETTLATMKADIESIKNSTSGKDQKDEIEKLAEEYGVDPAFAKKLADNITSRIKSPISEDELEILRDTKIEKEQNKQFESEFNELVEIHPEAKDQKAKLKALAFDKKYAGKNFKPLYYIYGKEVKSAPKSKSAEPSSTKKVDNSVLDYDTMEESEAVKLPPDKFLEWAERKSVNKA